MRFEEVFRKLFNKVEITLVRRSKGQNLTVRVSFQNPLDAPTCPSHIYSTGSGDPLNVRLSYLSQPSMSVIPPLSARVSSLYVPFSTFFL